MSQHLQTDIAAPLPYTNTQLDKESMLNLCIIFWTKTDSKAKIFVRQQNSKNNIVAERFLTKYVHFKYVFFKVVKFKKNGSKSSQTSNQLKNIFIFIFIHNLRKILCYSYVSFRFIVFVMREKGLSKLIVTIK